MKLRLDPRSPNGLSVVQIAPVITGVSSSSGGTGVNNFITVSTAPTTGSEDVFYLAADDPTSIYYFYGGNRYLITSTLNNPAASAGPYLSLGLNLLSP